MKTINFCFRVHQRYNLKKYRFFEIGNDHYYYDDYMNEMQLQQEAEMSYIEANRVLLEMINNSNKKFKVSFAITGLALEQFQQSAPQLIESFQTLAHTGCVEFLATPYAHSLASIYDEDEFVRQVKMQSDKIYELFGKRPTVFANSALIYSDEIADMVYKMGYKTIILEGAKHIIGWKSPHYLYSHNSNSKIKLILRDNKLSNDINYKFSQWNWEQYPLTADKFISWIDASPSEEEIYNIFMGYEALGKLNVKESGIFEFFKALPYFAMEKNIGFSTSSEIASQFKPVGKFEVQYPMSWTDEEKDISAWCGNELQNEALSKLYNLSERVNLCNDMSLQIDWQRLQDSAHFFFMTTKHYSDGVVYSKNIPYESPYEAFMNYMNVLSDFIERVKAQYPSNIGDEELNALLKTIKNQEQEINNLQAQIKRLKQKKNDAK